MITSITRSRTVRINLGNYESTDIFVSMNASVDPDFDDPAAIAAQLQSLVNTEALRHVFRNYQARGKKETPTALKKRYGL